MVLICAVVASLLFSRCIDDAFGLNISGGVNVLVWRDRITAGSLRALRECTRELAAEYEGVATITMARTAISLAQAAGDLNSEARGYLYWGQALWRQGNYEAGAMVEAMVIGRVDIE